jgi:HK97 gp10 family phage protein
MAVSFKIEGGADLSRHLLELNDKLQKKILRAAVVAGAQVVKKRAKQIARSKGVEDTGALIRNIAGKVEKQRSPEYVQINIGVRHGKPNPKAKRQDDPFYWHMHEFGTSKMAARPFIRPAFEESKEEALGAMVERVKKGLENA